jgi:hypothetical protein
MTTISNEKQYRHFMVDCETLGTLPNRNPVLQIAVVHFNPESFDALESFECFLPLAEQLKMQRIPDQGTVNWWKKQDPKVSEVIFGGVAKAPPLKNQLEELSNWIASSCKLDNGFAESVFWAKPAAFDYPFIDGLFVESGIPSPFHFRKVVDIQSYIIGAFKQTHYVLNHYQATHHACVESYWACFEETKRKLKGRDNAHNAAADCLFQLEWLKEAIVNCTQYMSEEGLKKTLNRKN